MKVYVVQMYRWGDEDGHSYIEGVYSNKEDAEKHGIAEQESRWDKYEFKIWTHTLDEPRKLKYMTDQEIKEAYNTPEMLKLKDEFDRIFEDEET